MAINRRRLLSSAAALPGTALIAAAADPVLAAQAIDAAQLGVRAGAADDQTAALQRAIDKAAATHTPLALGPGVYKAGALKLPAGAQIVGVRGATRLVFTRGPSLLSCDGADNVTLSGLVLDGGGNALPERRGLVHLAQGRAVRIADCEVLRSGKNGLVFEQIEGRVTGTIVSDAADTAMFSLDGRGVLISGNTIRGAGNGGIRVWQSEKRDDGTLIADNRIEDTSARAGGDGHNGNGINVFRAAHVIVRGNRVRNAAFSAIRGASASNIQIIGNSCSGLGEVALYCEFEFEGAVVSGNTVDGAATGLSVTNFNNGGRLATVQGNVFRNITRDRPQRDDPENAFSTGIAVEADTAVTGNIVENALGAGIAVGWGRYQRDVNVTGNIVRGARFGITASVAAGAGAAVIANNLISGATRGAIVGMDQKKPMTPDLAKNGPGPYSNLTISGNQVR
jgi:uncharacterized secreted repeat protein (TIGR03808 family)